MTEQWKWAPVRRIKEVAEEFKAIIRSRCPDAQFTLSRAEDDRRLWLLWTLVDVEDLEEVRALTIDRGIDLMVEDHVPLYVIPTRDRFRFPRSRPKALSKTG